MTDFYKIASAYGVSVEWLRQETARGVDWSTAVDPTYIANRQVEIDEQTRLWKDNQLAKQRAAQTR